MKTEIERFLYAFNQSGLSQTAFGASLGLSKSQMSHIISGRTKPSREVLEKLVLKYKINLNWLITGGNLLSAYAHPAADFGQGYLQEESKCAFVELINQEAAAGKGIYIEEYPETSTIAVPQALIHPHKPSRLKAVFVSGDSMIEEKIFDGDIVIFCPQITSGNAVYVVSINDSLLVKRVHFDGIKNTITLISANSCYPPRVLTDDELESVKIEGKVIACLHKM
jgi:SOS-response transcriptional repressor LexA